MGSPLLPPRGVFVPTRLIFDHALPPTLRDTLVQLMALAWSNPAHELPPVSYDQLANLTGKSVTTLHSHFAILKCYHSALRLRVAGDGLIIVTLAVWLYTKPWVEKTGFPESMPIKESDQDQDQEEDEEEILALPLNDLDHSALQNHAETVQKPVSLEDFQASMGVTASIPPVSEAVKPTPELNKGLEKELIQAGVFSFLLPEVARSGRSKKDLLALLTWCEEDQPERPGGLFMARLRKGARVPDRFYGKRCPECHKVGKHARTCHKGFLDGIPEYGD